MTRGFAQPFREVCLYNGSMETHRDLPEALPSLIINTAAPTHACTDTWLTELEQIRAFTSLYKSQLNTRRMFSSKRLASGHW